MKIMIKRIAAAALAVMIVIALALPVFAEGMTYSVSKNSGARGEACLTLDGTHASEYYTGSNSPESLTGLSERELLDALRALMTQTHKYKSSYADSKNYADKTDCQREDGSILLLYTSVAVKTSDFIGSGSIGWNREHVWPKSLGGFDNTGAGSDLHHIRPDDVTTNAKRGNLKYGNVPSGTDVNGSSLVSGALGGRSANGYFEPLDDVKGDVARICLYVYARYGGELSKCSNITNVFESIDVLLAWCAGDPVDTWEMGRNEVIYKVQGNRNVFIDYPEYAWLLFGREIPKDMSTPSGMANKTEESDEAATEVTTEAATEATTQASTEITSEILTEGSSHAPEKTDPNTEDENASANEKGCGSVLASATVILIPAICLVIKKKDE